MKFIFLLILTLGAGSTLGAPSNAAKKTAPTTTIEDKGFVIQMQEDQVRGAEIDKQLRNKSEYKRNKKLIQDAEKAMKDEVDF